MKKNGAEVIHLATGLLVGYPPCPHIEAFRRFIPRSTECRSSWARTRSRRSHFLTHDHCGTWQAAEWKPLLQATLADEPTRLAYD